MPLGKSDDTGFSGDDDQEDSKSQVHASPESDYMRKRRQRSNSSTEATSAWNIPEDHRYRGSTFGGPGQSQPSPTTAHLHIPSPVTASEGGSGSSRGQEDSLTVRRREANRLAAQRFRSRKKGYQDSLEEKVRQLEEDKELLIRRLTENSGVALPNRRLSTSRLVDDRVENKNNSHSASFSYTQPTSPDHREAAVDADVRIAALESANRRLQDELRVVTEENDKLREELDFWRRWERDQREGPWTSDPRRSPLHPPHSSELGSMVHGQDRRGPLPPYPTQSGFSTGLTPSTAQLPLRSPTDVSHPPPPSPGFRLPPIRLPPLQTPGATQDRSASSIGPPQYLPRAVELDNLSLGLLPPPNTRPPGSSSDDRRRRE